MQVLRRIVVFVLDADLNITRELRAHIADWLEDDYYKSGMEAFFAGVHSLFALSYHSYGQYLMYSYGCVNPDEMVVMDTIAQAHGVTIAQVALNWLILFNGQRVVTIPGATNQPRREKLRRRWILL